MRYLLVETPNLHYPGEASFMPDLGCDIDSATADRPHHLHYHLHYLHHPLACL